VVVIIGIVGRHRDPEVRQTKAKAYIASMKSDLGIW